MTDLKEEFKEYVKIQELQFELEQSNKELIRLKSKIASLQHKIPHEIRSGEHYQKLKAKK